MPDPLDSETTESSIGVSIDSGFDPLTPNHSRAVYESLVNTLPLSLLIKDVDGRRLFANDAYLKRHGCTLEAVLGKRDQDLFPAEIARSYAKDDETVIRTGQSLHSVEQAIDRNGQRRWIERIKSPVMDSNQRVIGVQLLFWDVTDRQIAESELKYERHLLAALLENLPDSIYFKDPDSRFVRISEAMARKFGLANAREAIGKTDADIFTETHAAAAREDELRIMRTGEPVVDLAERETWPDRDDTWCLSTKMPLKDDRGKVIGTFGLSRDITDLKKYEDELCEARDAADAANKAKSDFLANMSHEIRTPMNAIIGLSELLAQSDLNPQQQDYINLVRDSADSLLTLLNEILDFSKIESRKLQLESIPFSLRDLIEKTAQTLAIRATKKGIELVCRVAPELPDRWLADPGRLRQVLINLIGNAVKFTDEGQVRVEVSAGEVSAGEVSAGEVMENTPARQFPLRFSVTDTGIGIPEDKHSAVLNPFTQADASTTRRFGGTGLGLAISKQLVELMEGTLRLESKPGKGTSFSFTLCLPLAMEQSADAKREFERLQPRPACKPMRVLVAEDGLANQHVAVGMLRAAGHTAVIACDGRQAVERWQNEPFDVVLMDMHMPVMDGIEATEAIRSHECVTGGHTPIIALTAAAMKEDAEACRRAGMDGYLTKPIHQHQLHAMLAKFDPDRSAGATHGFLSDATVAEESDSRDNPAGAGSDLDSGAAVGSGAAESELSMTRFVSIDLQAAAGRLPGGNRGVRRLAEVFIGECVEIMELLRNAIPDGDPVLVARSAHTLKGSSNLFFAHGVHEMAVKIETKARENDLPGAVADLAQLEAEVDQMLGELNAFLATG